MGKRTPRAEIEAQYPIMAQGIIQGKSLDQIAEECGVKKSAMSVRLKKPEFMNYMTYICQTHLSNVKTKIDELWESRSPADRRKSAELDMRLIQILLGYLYPKKTLTRSENLNIDMTIQRHDRQTILDNLDPDTQRKVIEAMQKNTPPTQIATTIFFRATFIFSRKQDLTNNG